MFDEKAKKHYSGKHWISTISFQKIVVHSLFSNQKEVELTPLDPIIYPNKRDHNLLFTPASS